MIEGSGCYFEHPILQKLDVEQRPNENGVMDGVVPGEAAGFIVINEKY